MKKNLPVIGVILLIIIGTALFLYPAVSNWLAGITHSSAIQDYDAEMAEMVAAQMESELQKAMEYNAALLESIRRDPLYPGRNLVTPENYNSILSVNGIIGHIKIPAIEVNLPIYHGISDEVLKKGVGHMEMTAFPIGGEGNHSVITAHTGLSSSELFTGLDKLTLGDKFYIRVLDKTLAYEVDQIIVVKPGDSEELLPVEGKDYVTLVTCTPYAINSHRLLVRGVSIPYTGGDTEQASPENPVNWNVVSVIFFIVLLISFFTYYRLGLWRMRRGN